jgi:murein DD-endopeptidase MepM/ murein hydrolase activator NlpD
MNPQTLKLIAAAFSMKKEIKIIFFTIIGICLLPVITVFLLTQEGISVVSNALASADPQTSNVLIHDPANGSIVETISEPRIWPVSGNVTLEFGQPDPPVETFHTGIDIASPDHQVGTPVAAFMAGTVIYAAETSTGFGKHVEIDHGNNIVSIYGHLDTIEATVGEQVEMGTIIGTRGNTGWSTGPHLHFQINVYGIPVNPRIFLNGNPAPSP